TSQENLSPEEKKIASRVQFTFFQKSTFFQVKLGGLGGWNHNGCYVKNSSENETICSCNHLTSFAVLLDISQQILPDLQDKILTFITYIGCGVSAIFLSVTLLIKNLCDVSYKIKIRRDIPSKILIHLCFSLLLLNLVFLLDSWLALYRDAEGLCIFTAFFLHYFLLVSFTWMGLEALHMYLAIVKVFNNFMSRYMLKFSLVGWGVPLVVVIIVIAVNKENYGLISYGRFSDGTKDFIAFYVAVVAYFCIIFVLNLAMFVVVMIHLRRIKRRNPHNNQYRSSLHDLRSVAGLTFLLGLTWGFAFFAWGPVHFAFTYMFTILNSLQGFLIFIFHCALKENVRKQWRMYLCCGSLRLAENSGIATLLTKLKTSCRLPLIDVLWVSPFNISNVFFFLQSGVGQPHRATTLKRLRL
uniref:Adhesion G protein-coupled receptor G2a n=1 Tax=Sinocyclocheilus rhinocerous TaxID=307959 RepID=A0A673NFJ8_9TELE